MKGTQYVARQPDESGFIHYSDSEHQVWNTLITRQMKVLEGRACQEYFDGIEQLRLPHERIPQLGEINRVLGASTGFYDGFFGPGAGSFMILLFIRFFGFDFLHASAASKVINVSTNLASIGFFIPHGYFLPLAAVIMASANITGSFIGTQLALRHGSGFVRRFFLVVVCALIAKFAWDSF